jgi:hypothetical protein
MVICHQHRYLFIEVPNTGSTAISSELRSQYGGEGILHKHATYAEFLRVATKSERRYFVFGTVRNPLDLAVTEYFKLKTNHRGRFTDQRRLGTPSLTTNHVRKFKFIHDEGADFPTFFRRFKVDVYNNYYLLLHRRFSMVMRFERLQDDFMTALRTIGITPIRPLPRVNTTAEKRSDFASYYTPDLYEHAKRLYAPFMRRWGYEFPGHWGPVRPSVLSEIKFRSLDAGASALVYTFKIGPSSRLPLVMSAREVVRRVWS